MKSNFWDENILLWEEKKYKEVFFDVNSSVKNRLNTAVSVLHQMPEGARLVELACGSGRLWEKINTLPFEDYTGVDFSKIAIESFQNKIKNFKNKNSLKVSLVCEDCTKNIYPADIVVSLGLLDWLDDKQVKNLAEDYKDTWYLHSFSEKRLSFSQIAHSLYSLTHYRKDYFPCYRRAGELLNIFGEKAKIYRNCKALNFSAFVYNLPSHVSISHVPVKK